MSLNLIRGIVRPVVLLVAVLATVYFVVAGTPVPDQWWQLASVMIAYFFIDRQAAKP